MDMLLPEYSLLLMVMVLLIIVLFYVSPIREKVNSLFRKETLHGFLNVQAKLKSIEFAPSAIITIDVDGYIVSWNNGACEMFGYREVDVIGRSLTIIMPDRYKDRHIEGLKKLKAGGKSAILGLPMEMNGITKGRVEFPIKLTIWRWSEGSNVFYTGIVQDISARKKTEEKVEKLLDIYRRSEEIDDSGSYIWDVLNDKVYTTDGFNKIFEIEPHDLENGAVDSVFLLKRIFHEDLAKSEEVVKKTFETKEGHTIEYRIVTRNGSILKLISTCETYLDKKGELISIAGIAHKIK